MTKLQQATPQTGTLESTIQIQLTSEEKSWLEANPELGRIAFQLRTRVQLSAAEREWLTTKQKIPIRTGDYPPFHFDVDDIPMGISVDYIKVICMAQNLDCNFVTGMTIADSIHSMQQPGGIAIQPAWQKNTAREKVAFFTGPYVVSPFVIFQRQGSKRIIGMEDLLDKRVVVEKNYAIHKMLKRDYPGLKLVEVNFSSEALELLATDGADAYVSSLMVGHYLSINLGLPNIVVASPAPFEPNRLEIAVRLDLPELAAIITKSIASITPEEHQNIRKRWLSIDYKKKVDYGLLWKISIGFLLVLAAVVAWNHIIRRQKAALADSEARLRKARDKANAATRAKSEFLANMSHEIRTPMNAVIGMAHLALKTELTPKQRDYLNKIRSSANSLLGIINDILDFSKIEAGKLDMEALEFDLAKTLDNAANVITVKAQEKENVEVLFHLDSEVPNFLVGDSLRLNQILINLGNNAVKFTEQGEIVLTTKLIEASDGKVTLQFSIRDTGIGMTKQQQNKLFQAFSQADTSTTRKYGGTGLGLTISKRLVNMMGGDIGVESESGKGTTFSFTANFGLGKETEKKRYVPSQDLRGLKVLVVDDSATSRGILQNILRSFSFDIYLAPSGEEALEEIEWADQNQPFDLVLMDWKMTGMDGLETARRVKTHKALKKKPAIVIVSAYGREEIIWQADEIRLDGFLHKPVSASMLFDTIMQALGKEVEDPSGISREIEKTTEGMQSIAGARVLLVEDNEINQQVAMEILQGAGLNLTIADNGQKGVDAAKKEGYDAILMDIQMPVMNGYEAVKTIRNWECGMRNESKDPIPIIAMTAHAMAGDEQRSLEAGMNDHITKPIDPGQLFETLQKWIKPAAERAEVPKSLPASGGPPVLDAPHVPDQAPPDKNELPESLPGFDLAAGLTRLMGNKRLYKKLLVDFGIQYTETAGEIRNALDAKDFEQAHSLVHNLKGLAGNLEAKDLQAAAVKMEKLVKSIDKKTPSPKQLNLRFSELENALTRALESVQSLGVSAEKNIDKPNAEELVDIPTELSQDIAKRIQDAANMGDVTTLNTIAEEIKTLSDSFVPLSKQIIQMVENLDLDGIQKLANALEAS